MDETNQQFSDQQKAAQQGKAPATPPATSLPCVGAAGAVPVANTGFFKPSYRFHPHNLSISEHFLNIFPQARHPYGDGLYQTHWDDLTDQPLVWNDFEGKLRCMGPVTCDRSGYSVSVKPHHNGKAQPHLDVTLHAPPSKGTSGTGDVLALLSLEAVGQGIRQTESDLKHEGLAVPELAQASLYTLSVARDLVLPGTYRECWSLLLKRLKFSPDYNPNGSSYRVLLDGQCWDLRAYDMVAQYKARQSQGVEVPQKIKALSHEDCLLRVEIRAKNWKGMQWLFQHRAVEGLQASGLEPSTFFSTWMKSTLARVKPPYSSLEDCPGYTALIAGLTA